VVGVYRSAESAAKGKTVLGDPSEDSFITVVGNFGKKAPSYLIFDVSSQYTVSRI